MPDRRGRTVQMAGLYAPMNFVPGRSIEGITKVRSMFETAHGHEHITMLGTDAIPRSKHSAQEAWQVGRNRRVSSRAAIARNGLRRRSSDPLVSLKGPPGPLQRVGRIGDEHLIMPITVAMPRSNLSAEHDLHVKQVL